MTTTTTKPPRFVAIADMISEKWERGGAIDLHEVVFISPAIISGSETHVAVRTKNGVMMNFITPYKVELAIELSNNLTAAFIAYGKTLQD